MGVYLLALCFFVETRSWKFLVRILNYICVEAVFATNEVADIIRQANAMKHLGTSVSFRY